MSDHRRVLPLASFLCASYSVACELKTVRCMRAVFELKKDIEVVECNKVRLYDDSQHSSAVLCSCIPYAIDDCTVISIHDCTRVLTRRG